MFETQKHMCLLVILASIFTGLYFLSYFGHVLPNNQEQKVVDLADNGFASTQLSTTSTTSAFDIVGRKNIHLDVGNNQDVLVFLHIQKTGGTTFGRHLVKDLNVTHPCTCYKRQKRCDCKNGNGRIWMFSRYSTGWVCGLHADWTELNDCVNEKLNQMEKRRRNRRYFYITMLRDPIQRYISEWKHVQRGSTWLSAKLRCNGRHATLEEVPFCFKGENWSGVTLEEFMSCPHNLALNRQTRMIANLSSVGCYNRSAMSSVALREEMMLESAKRNLREMAYFGLTEYQSESQILFEETFQVNFSRNFVQHRNTHASRVEISAELLQKLKELNRLDVQLYDYALELFSVRLQHISVSFNRTSIL